MLSADAVVAPKLVMSAVQMFLYCSFYAIVSIEFLHLQSKSCCESPEKISDITRNSRLFLFLFLFSVSQNCIFYCTVFQGSIMLRLELILAIFLIAGAYGMKDEKKNITWDYLIFAQVWPYSLCDVANLLKVSDF